MRREEAKTHQCSVREVSQGWPWCRQQPHQAGQQAQSVSLGRPSQVLTTDCTKQTPAQPGSKPSMLPGSPAKDETKINQLYLQHSSEEDRLSMGTLGEASGGGRRWGWLGKLMTCGILSALTGTSAGREVLIQCSVLFLTTQTYFN